MAGGVAETLLEFEDMDELLLEELVEMAELEDELIELLNDELLNDAALEDVSPDPCPPQAPIMTARAATPRILKAFIKSTLLTFHFIVKTEAQLRPWSISLN